jgi:hypothetical protein
MSQVRTSDEWSKEANQIKLKLGQKTVALLEKEIAAMSEFLTDSETEKFALHTSRKSVLLKPEVLKLCVSASISKLKQEEAARVKHAQDELATAAEFEEPPMGPDQQIEEGASSRFKPISSLLATPSERSRVFLADAIARAIETELSDGTNPPSLWHLESRLLDPVAPYDITRWSCIVVHPHIHTLTRFLSS